MNNFCDIKSAVVTGCTGAVGTALCSVLLENGIEVYAVVRPDTSRASNLPAGVKTVFCDIADIDRLPEMIASADAFFHLAWAHTIGEGRNDMAAQTENIAATVKCIAAAKKLGVKVFLGAGSQAEYGVTDGTTLTPDTPCDPKTGYGIAKLCAGQMAKIECRKLGIKCIWVRILSIYGPCDTEKTMVMSAIAKLLSGECAKFTPAEQMWDYLYSFDAAEALLAAAKNGRDGAVYPLGSGIARPLSEYIKEIARECESGKVELGAFPYSENQIMYLRADISTLTRDTGFVPKTSFTDGIKKTVEWYKKERLT